MDNFSEFLNSLKAVDAKNAYNDFISNNIKKLENIFDVQYDFLMDAFLSGFKEGKAKGRLDEKINVRMKVISNLIKFTELDNDTICNVVGISDEEQEMRNFIIDLKRKLEAGK